MAQTTVRDIIEQAFPDGYRDYSRYLADVNEPEDQAENGAAPQTPHKAKKPSFREPPCTAVDLFALTGQLLLKSGAYHHVSPEVSSLGASRRLFITEAMRSDWRAIGTEWRGDAASDLPPPPERLVEHWKGLMAYADEPIFPRGGGSVTMEWWRHAIALFCIADEAALHIGFLGYGEASAQAAFTEVLVRAPRRHGKKLLFSRSGPSTLALDANPDVLAVLPKSRTANVGCTLRSMSHNLTLLPGRGQARAHWSFAPESDIPQAQGDPAPFNLVILPAPFGVQAHAFKGHPADTGKWGWFEVEPHWCPRSSGRVYPSGTKRFIAFVDAVLEQAEQDCGTVHGLVLPEVALSHMVFRALCKHLIGRPGFELLISGLFDMQRSLGANPRPGNFTGMASFSGTGADRTFDTSIREKHHRWRIDRTQIETYALGSALDVNRGWWEQIDIRSRDLDVFVLRGNATVTTLICEDLARNDPCQELVRGIGPNFVVALLMDGPQRRDRWPARYATVLADDPGSSVLSVTSYGLMARTNRTGAFPKANQIGLFRDDTGNATEIQLPEGAQGVCLTLQPTHITEHTLDGRADMGDSQSWRLSAVQPVALPPASLTPGIRDILHGNWPRAVNMQARNKTA